MGFDNLFENYHNQLNYGHYDDHNRNDNQRYMNEGHHVQHGYDKSYYLNILVDKIKNNRKLQIWIGILSIIFLAIIIALLIILIPLIGKLINFISQHGIQGVVDNISGFLNKIWKGAGK